MRSGDALILRQGVLHVSMLRHSCLSLLNAPHDASLPRLGGRLAVVMLLCLAQQLMQSDSGLLSSGCGET